MCLISVKKKKYKSLLGNIKEFLKTVRHTVFMDRKAQ